MAETLRMPITVASRKGISAVADAAEQQRVLLTNHGRPVAVVDSAERVDEDLRKVRDAARLVVEAFADKASTDRPQFDLSAVCDHLGIDINAVRAQAASQLARR